MYASQSNQENQLLPVVNNKMLIKYLFNCIAHDGRLKYKWIYERSYIWAVEKDMNLWLIIAVIQKIQAWTGIFFRL